MINKPKLIPPDEGESPWTLNEDWFVHFDGRDYRVPEAFETDGASIPRALWRICGTPLAAPRLYAAILHDWLYTAPHTPRGYDCDKPLTRKEADQIFRDFQIELGVSKIKACVEYACLRVCGGSHWQETKTAETTQEGEKQ